MRYIKQLELLKQQLKSHKENKKGKIIKEKENRIKNLIKEKEFNKTKKIKLTDKIKAFLTYPITLVCICGLSVAILVFIMNFFYVFNSFSWLLPLGILILLLGGLMFLIIFILLDKNNFMEHYRSSSGIVMTSEKDIDFMIKSLKKEVNEIKYKKYKLSFEDKEESIDLKTLNILSSCLKDEAMLMLYISENENEKITYGQLEKFILIMRKKENKNR